MRFQKKRFVAGAAQIHIWARKDGNALLTTAACLYVLVFALFWPQSYTTMDEASYMDMAYTLRQGTVFPDVAGIQAVFNYPVHSHMVTKYPLGMPALLALISYFGWSATLGTNLIIHLLTFFAVIQLLRRLQIPAVFALLYLLHPTAVIYSRTVMADPASGLLLTCAFYSYLSRRDVLCGMLTGLTVIMRTGNLIILPILVIACCLEKSMTNSNNLNLQSRLKKVAWILLGASAPLVAALYYSSVVQGGSTSKYGGSFSLAYFPKMFGYYALAMMLIYPAMLFGPLLYRGAGRLLLNLLCYGFMLMYSLWYFRDQGSSPIETLIIGQRFMLVVLPLFIVAYSAYVWQVVQKWPQHSRVFLGSCAMGLLLVLAIGISRKHALYLASLSQVRTSILQVDSPQDYLICNMQIAKLFHPGWGMRQYWVTSSENYALNLSLTKSHISEALLEQHNKVILALWSRGYREEAPQEEQLMTDIKRLYNTRPLTDSERHGLPSNVKVLQILTARQPQ